MIQILDLFLWGDPVPARREARIVAGHAVAAWSKRYERWKNKHRPKFQQWHVAQGEPAALSLVVLEIEIDAVFARPKRAPVLTVNGKRHHYPLPWATGRNPYLSRPDYDNLAKGPGDLLVEAGICQDDCWIVRGDLLKSYAAVGERPHTRVTLRQIGAPSPEAMWPSS